MPKQRCGSCRFFQDAGLAGSGWCHHPLRKTASDLLIMVRRNELACRDEWTRTLWEEGTFSGPDAMPAQPVDPATEVEIAALLRTGLEADDAKASDVVLGEARLVSDATPPWRLPASGLAAPAVPAPPAASFDSRTAILRAREAYRERVKAAERERPTPAQSASFVAAAETIAGVAAVPENDPTEEAGTPADVGFDEPAPSQAQEAGWGPEHDAHESPLHGEVAAGPPAVEGFGLEPELDQWDSELAFDGRTDDPLASEDHPAFLPAAEAAADAAAPRQWEAIPVEPFAEAGAWTPIQAEWQPEPTTGVDADWSPVGVQAQDDDLWEPEAGAASFTAHPEPDPDGGWRGTPVWDEAWIAGLARESARGEHWAEWDVATEDDEPDSRPLEPAAFEQDVEIADLAPAAVDLVLDPAPMSAARMVLAPNVPRVCRTCRDFRPAEGGDRGWCANQWAFTHRRLVDPEEPAPCESSIGSWWLPADDLYLGDADISAHGLSTPLLDRWLPGHVVAEPERKQS